MSGQWGFFDIDARYAALSTASDPLQPLSAVVDFEVFRPVLDAALARSDRARGGRPPYDAVVMFRVLVLQALYSLSDEQAEFQLRDRLSFLRFVDLELHDPVPDAKAILLYREQLKRVGAIDELFHCFDAVLTAEGCLAMGGQVIDATIVAAPKQKLTEDEKAVIKQGGIPPQWPPAKRGQKDRDARWTLKRGRASRNRRRGARQDRGGGAGVLYKSHLNIDRRHGLIRAWTVTDAAAHDSRSLPAVLDTGNTASSAVGQHGVSKQAEPGGVVAPRVSREDAISPAAARARVRSAIGSGRTRAKLGACVVGVMTFCLSMCLPARSTG